MNKPFDNFLQAINAAETTLTNKKNEFLQHLADGQVTIYFIDFDSDEFEGTILQVDNDGDSEGWYGFKELGAELEEPLAIFHINTANIRFNEETNSVEINTFE